MGNTPFKMLIFGVKYTGTNSPLEIHFSFENHDDLSISIL